MSEIPLGKQTNYPTRYDPGLLFPVERLSNRSVLDLGRHLPFGGFDHWRAYELSWLTGEGMPAVATADILVPCQSPYLIESKSMKLYFNSLNQHRFRSQDEFLSCIENDLSRVAGATVVVHLHKAAGASEVHTTELTDAELLDDIVITDPLFSPDATILTCNRSEMIRAKFLSHLFRSNCPVTAQPDWGSILIDYEGPAPDKDALLHYIISYRQHEGFHEHCVERIFNDLLHAFMPSQLTVSINFLRRGGLEINPVRSLDKTIAMTALPRLLRQ